MAQRRVYQLHKASSVDELIKQLQPLLGDLSEFIGRVEGRTGSPLQFQRDVPFNSKRITFLGKPLDPSDGVRLQDLQDLERRILRKLRGDALVDDQSFSSTTNNSTQQGGVEFGVGFVEAFDSQRFLFTPEILPALDSSGRPRAHLVYRDADIRWSATTPPAMGQWYWDEATLQMELHPAQAPHLGDYLEFAVLVAR